MSESQVQRRATLRGLMTGPTTLADLHRAYVAAGHWISTETIRSDLAALEQERRVERYQAEYGDGYVWMPL